MDVWQLKRQIAFLLAALIWADAPGALVFTGGAFVSEDLDGNFAPASIAPDGPVTKSIPFARVSCSDWDLEEGRVERARFRLFATTGGWSPVIAGGSTSATGYDTHGINQVTGALRATPNGQGQSVGRDVDELLGRLLESLTPAGMNLPGTCVDSIHGFQGWVARGEGMVAIDGVQVLRRALELEVTSATASRHYHAPQNVQVTKTGSGTTAIAWVNPPARFDTLKTLLRRGQNSGDPAPATLSQGVNVPLSGNLATSATDSPGPGTWNYAAFHSYAEITPGVADRLSDPAPANTVSA